MPTLSEITPANLFIAGSLGVFWREYDAGADDLPEDVATTIDGARTELEALNFVLLGATTNEGSNFRETKQRTKHYVHQQRNPVLVTEDQVEAVFQTTLHEYLNQDAIVAAYGGGTWTTTSNGNAMFVPPEPGTLAYGTFVVDALFNNQITRYVLERCTTGGDTDVPLRPTQMTGVPMTVDALSPTNAPAAWYMIAPNPGGGS